MSKLCLVTNATAKSICWYVTVYMKEQNLSEERIYEIKKKLNFNDINNPFFEIDDFIKSFNDKNIYFLKLYEHLKKENRYLNFLNHLGANRRLHNYFPNFSEVSSIYNDYNNRKIYHSSIFCKWITKDYISETRRELNTGVYADDLFKDRASYYKIDEEYLQKLKLQECNICQNISLKSCRRFLELYEILYLISISSKISLSYEIIKKNEYVLQMLFKKVKEIKIEIYIFENQSKTIDFTHFTNSNFIFRLIHKQFTFFNDQSVIVLNNALYFYQADYFCMPDENYINMSAIQLLQFNTVLLSKIDKK